MRNVNEGIANDVVRLALDGELFTTDGEQVKKQLGDIFRIKDRR